MLKALYLFIKIDIIEQKTLTKHSVFLVKNRVQSQNFNEQSERGARDVIQLKINGLCLLKANSRHF